MTSRRIRGATSPGADHDISQGVSTGSSASSSDNEGATHAFRSSTDQARHDQEILNDEEEQQKLLTGRSDRTNDRHLFQGLSRSSRHGRIHSGDYDDDKKELMYDTEEGRRRSSTPSLSSFEEGNEKVDYTTVTRKGKKASCCAICCKYTSIALLIAALFVGISLGAYKATREDAARSPASVKYVSNGTHSFAPTTVLISLDGFRADFLQRGLTPTLNGFIREGVSPKYMLPSFPSVTFPNHYTLVTGLYPESHGVVGNSFWDPDLQEEFYYTDPAAMDAKWWGGEPLWVTAEEQGVRVATHMWPGSEAHIGDFEPAFVDKYNGSELLGRKVDTILAYLDKPGPNMLNTATIVDDQRPQLIAAYVPNVDADGHKYGPNSTDIRDTIQSVDTMLGLLLDGLHTRNLTSIVNVVVVSDHGMATTSTSRTIQFEDLIDPDLIAHIDGWPHYGLRPKDPSTIPSLYAHLREIQTSTPNPGFDVYTKETMPPRYHFTHSPRIAPLWLIPRTGWAIVRRSEFDVQTARAEHEIYHPRGIHGYDHEHPLMRAIFVARGPAFPHVGGSRVGVFQNTEVYNILCDSVGVVPKANNGTLRLPFKTEGVHGDDFFNEGEVPDDPAVALSDEVDESEGSEIVRPEIQDGDAEEVATAMTWAEWVKAKTEALKEWFSNALGVPEEDIVIVEEMPFEGGEAQVFQGGPGPVMMDEDGAG